MATAFSITRLGVEVNLPVGATYDLLVVTTPNYPVGPLSFQFESTPRKITGLQKVAQTFLRILFTTKGSDLLNASFGTAFPDLAVGSNRMQSDSEFRSEITSAINDAASQTQYVLNSSTSDLADQLTSVNIQGIYSQSDNLSLYLKILTAAGESASVSIPFPELTLALASNV